MDGKGTKRKRPAAVRAKRKRTIIIDNDLKKLICQEAKRLNLSEEEYLRLVVHFSEAVRTSSADALPAGVLDGGILKMVLTNPMAMNMIKGLIGNMMTRFTNKEPAAQAPAAQAPGPGPGMPRPFGMHPGGMPHPPGPGWPMHAPFAGMAAGPHGGFGMMPGMPGAPAPQAKPEEKDNGMFSMEGLGKMMMQFFGNSGSNS